MTFLYGHIFTLKIEQLSVPVGASGTEYGGIDCGVSGKQLGTESNVFT
jgi:hypothetical protein